MKFIRKETREDGKTVLYVEDKGWFRKKIRSFVANRLYVADYWEWLELPDNTLVEDILSFQLDVWKNN